MPEIVQCPECVRKLRVPDDLLGKKVKCPTCGNLFVADVGGSEPAREKVRKPAAQRPPESDEDEYPDDRADDRGDGDRDYDDEEDRRRRRRRRKSREPRRDAEPHRGTLVLVLGILSVVTGLGLILGPIAWVMGSHDLKEIRAGRMDDSGEGQTNGGMICGIVGTCVGVLELCCCGANIFSFLAELSEAGF
jgi:predicted Zn finger-like uncharacterized protein